MKNIEDKYKRLFHDEQIPNDDNFDVEGLWDNVVQDLDQKKTEEKKKKTPSYFFWLFAGVSVIGLLYLIKNNYTVPQDTRVELNNEIDAINENDDNTLTLSSNDEDKKIIEEENIQAIEEDNETVQSVNVEQMELSDIEQTDKDLIALMNSTNSISKFLKSISSKLPNTTMDATDQEDLTKENITDIDSQKTPTNSNQKIQISKPRLSELQNTSMISLPLMSASIESKLTWPVLELSEIKIPRKKKTKSLVWQIGLFGGVNTTSLKYKSKNASDLANLKEQASNNELGGSFGIELTALLKNRWILSSGLEYHQFNSRFEYVEKKSFDVVKENQLLTVWVDATSGDTISTNYGDATVKTISTREVVHYNKYKKISLPIEVGYYQNFGKVIYGLSTGVAVNFNSFQSGKALNKNAEIVAFDKNSSATTTFSKIDLGFRVSPFIGYRITENLNLTIRPQLSWQFNSKFDDTDIKTTAQQLNLNLGIGYYFK